MSTSLLSLVLIQPASVASIPAPLEPRIYGGTSASGNPGVVGLAINTGGSWDSSCSAAVWRPRILLTAGHCVTLIGSSSPVPGLAIFPPGGSAVQFSNTGPQGATGINVSQVIMPASYVNASTRVEPNDFAILVLDSDIGPQYYSRLATSSEMSRWAQELYPGTIMGYGLTGPNQRGFTPMQAQVPIDTYEPASRFGPVFSVSQSASVGVCSGDSGGPTFATNAQGERLLLGVNSGSAGGCVAGFTGDYLMIGFTAIDYLDLLNQALTSAGYPTIPSTPQAVALTAINNSVNVSWQPPAISPSTVVGYEVIDPTGAVVCETTQLSCQISGLAEGIFSFTVRAKNAQSEGNALPATLSAAIVPPAQMSPPRLTKKAIRFTTLAGSTSAVVTQYRVVDVSGKRICTIRSFDPMAKQLSCPLPTKAGTYRFRVTAVTEMGQTPPSGLSKSRTIS